MSDVRHPPPDDLDDATPTVLAPTPGAAVVATPAAGPPLALWVNGLPKALPARLGRYELLKLLGKGGMGAVYLAHDEQLHRLVAIKIPHFGGPQQLHLRERFLREARVAATLSHPNLCPVYDCDEIDGVVYLSMAYLEGKPLARFIRPGKPLPAKHVVMVVRQLALAMQEAHSKGVIHRDLKPANIMITPTKQPVIMDFGLARRTDLEDQHLTQSGLLMGTPAYMPPEQLNSDAKAMGPATDIYSLGVILYELLSGKPPFQGPLGELMTRIMTEPPPPLVRARGDLPPALDAICTKALAKKPAERFASMAELAGALDAYLHGRYRVPEPDPPTETYELVEADDARPLDEDDPAGLFRAMAARQARAARHAARPRPSRRRSRVRLPDWLIPLVVSVFALWVMGYTLWWFFDYLGKRSHRPDAVASTLDPAAAGEEQRRLAEQRTLEQFVRRLREHPVDPAASQELDAWLDSPAGRRLDLSSDVNFGLGLHLLLDRDQWSAGLRRLALTGESPWRTAAEADLAAEAAESPVADVAAGDRWWQLSDGLSGAGKIRLQARAKRWYDRALPHLSGVEADRIRRRLTVLHGTSRPT
jgi:hypothetical protein